MSKKPAPDTALAVFNPGGFLTAADDGSGPAAFMPQPLTADAPLSLSLEEGDISAMVVRDVRLEPQTDFETGATRVGTVVVIEGDALSAPLRADLARDDRIVRVRRGRLEAGRFFGGMLTSIAVLRAVGGDASTRILGAADLADLAASDVPPGAGLTDAERRASITKALREHYTDTVLVVQDKGRRASRKAGSKHEVHDYAVRLWRLRGDDPPCLVSRHGEVEPLYRFVDAGGVHAGTALAVFAACVGIELGWCDGWAFSAAG